MPDENASLASVVTMPAPSERTPPVEPKTVKFDAVPPWAIELQVSMKTGFTGVNTRLDNLEGSDKNIADEVSRVRRDIVDLRSDTVRHEDEIRRLSIRTNGTAAKTSEHDLEQASQLAQERSARESLAAEHAATRETVESIKTKTDSIEKKTDTQTVMLIRIGSVLDKPLVKKIGYAAGALLLALLTTATGYLARGNVQAAQPTIIQVAPMAAIDAGPR